MCSDENEAMDNALEGEHENEPDQQNSVGRDEKRKKKNKANKDKKNKLDLDAKVELWLCVFMRVCAVFMRVCVLLLRKITRTLKTKSSGR